MSTNSEFIEFPCLELTQPIGTFFVGVIRARDVIDISFTDVHRIKDRDVERMVGIQRKLSPKRERELQRYVQHIDATFPTSIILAVTSDDASYNRKKGLMTLRRHEDAAQIIDGQHRIAGLQGFQERFDLNVTVFVDMDLQDRAMTFATINLSQTKVNKSLVYNLYEFQKARSPVKTCHQIARLLNRESDSPLVGRIKILGTATGELYENITQAAFVESLVQYISDDPDGDRDALRRGKKLPNPPEKALSKLIFHNLFREKRDAEIAKIVSNLFVAVAQRWPNAWEAEETGQILNRTTGFTALMKFLGPLYRKYESNGKLSRNAISAYLNNLSLKDRDFTRDKYKPGGSGVSALFNDLEQKL